MITRRTLLAAAITTPAAPAILRPKAPDSINLAYFTSARPVMIAKAFGWFQDGTKSRINWNDSGGGSEINAAIGAGTIDIAIGLTSLQAAAGISQGLPFRVIGIEANTGGDEDLITRHTANIRKPADLKGKKISVPLGSTAHFRLLGFLRTHGLAPGDVTLVDHRPEAILAAWNHGDIDGAYVWNPVRGKLLAAGGDPYDTAHDLDAAGYTVADLIVARGVFLDQFPDAVAGILRGYGRAIDLWKAKPAEAAEDVAKQANLSTDAAQAEMAECDFPTLKAQASPAWLGERSKFPAVLKRTADFLVEQKTLRSAPAQPVFDKAIDANALGRAIT